MENEVVMEFNFTNAKTFKVVFSKDLREALSLTKIGNKQYKNGDFDGAAASYKKALPLWNNCIRELKAVPETQVGWISLADWVVFVPLLNFAWIIASAAANVAITTAYSGNVRYVSPKLADKLNEAMQTKAFSKTLVMQALVLVQDYTEDRVKECSGGRKSAFESYLVAVSEGFIDFAIECCDGLYDVELTTPGSSLLESFINDYT